MLSTTERTSIMTNICIDRKVFPIIPHIKRTTFVIDGDWLGFFMFGYFRRLRFDRNEGLPIEISILENEAHTNNTKTNANSLSLKLQLRWTK